MQSLRSLVLSLFILLLSQSAWSSQSYLTKFMDYLRWCQNLPILPVPEFIDFINEPGPLAHKLREKWLYQLAKTNNWVTYTQFYQPSTDTTLQCYEQLGLYKQGRIHDPMFNINTLWLNGNSSPKACDELFASLLKTHVISDNLLSQRIVLALRQRNVSLAHYLLKQYSPPKSADDALLTAIQMNPLKINSLNNGPLHGEFYLYGLKRILTKNMPEAIRLFNSKLAQTIMNVNEQQDFLTMVALYKAMRNADDTPLWFAKIKPQFYTDNLLDWEIRYALAKKNWQKVISLISKAKNQTDPGRMYWHARALSAIGRKDEAREIYQQLAATRNYYGFLACFRLHKMPSFTNEPANHNLADLSIYQPITDKIQALYNTNQAWLASRMLNDFTSELPKNEQSALAYWVSENLHWHGKSVYLSNNEVLNNQLSLRFPLAYYDTIVKDAALYNVPKELIYATIRQESTFFDDIRSSVGANGLMQIMPYTAKLVAKRAHIPFRDSKELFSTQKNIHIGTAYLKQLFTQFGNHPVLVVAAYNAGPRQVNYWLKNHPPKEIDIWIDTLPWGETRNYLKNVIAFYAVYQYRLRKPADINAFLQPLK